MCDLCRQIFGSVVDLFRSRAALEAEVLVLIEIRLPDRYLEPRLLRWHHVTLHFLDCVVDNTQTRAIAVE
jgi:hypothetical protein